MERTEFKSHISQRYNQHLEDLFNQVLEMGGLVEVQLKHSAESIKDEDRGLAKEVRQIDKIVNQGEMDIDRLAASVLARQEPKASDLRLIVSAIRIAVDLERIGDEAVNVSKLAIKVSKHPELSCQEIPGYQELLEMCATNSDMLSKVLSGFAQLDLAGVTEIPDNEERVLKSRDAALKSIKDALNGESEGKAEYIMEMIYSIRSSERVTAHIVNIAQSIIYLINGNNVRNMDSKKLADFLNQI